MTDLTLPDRDRETTLRIVNQLESDLEDSSDPGEIRKMELRMRAIQDVMETSHLFTITERQRFAELCARARWKLGNLLAEMERKAGRPSKNSSRAGNNLIREGKSFGNYLLTIGLDKNRASEAQQIAAVPWDELEQELAKQRQAGIVVTIRELLQFAKPFWFKLRRKQKHEDIAQNVTGKGRAKTGIGPFPLLYADPPWKFENWSEEGGLGRSPDDHYPTLSDVEIKEFKIADRFIYDLATTDAALFLWCTPANLQRALKVMEYWEFEYKTHMVWVKCTPRALQLGTGYIFRNCHELLLYGSRGNMPAPQAQPASIMFAPRREHSQKPEQVRAMLESMYPDFTEATRLELFARGEYPGWTCRGFEAKPIEAEPIEAQAVNNGEKAEENAVQ